MRPVDNKPLSADPALVANIKSEVSQESRPLLEFIISNSRIIVGVVVLLVVALLGTGIYRYVEGSRRADTLDQLARIMQAQPSADQLAALESLSASCPSGMRVAVAVAMVRSAVAQNQPEKAEEAYAMVSKAEYDSPVGLAAAINQAGMLMKAEKYAEGVKVLQGLLPRLTPETGGQARLMLAEGAARAGQYELAAGTYEELEKATATALDKDYYAARANELRALARAGAEDAKDAPAADR